MVNAKHLLCTFLPTVLLIGMGALQAPAQTVATIQGTIIYTARDGAQRQLTSTGLDSQPSLSFDGKRVVFVRSTPDLKIQSPVSEVDDCCTIANEIWIADVSATSKPHRILRGRPGYWRAKRGRSVFLAGFGEPHFSRDGTLIFFSTQGGADAFAYYSLNLQSGVIDFLYSGVGFEMIRSGKYAGYIMADVFLPCSKAQIANGNCTHVPTACLLDPQGRLLRPIADVREFRKRNGIPPQK